ncbi:hypothetical protein VSS37_17115 [Candidatus Thiothrix sp. Deng01]|uniref:Uncharacterized protein n=1 Tax=Candidatus Thiothrix phosphatis TaxID=3112415 RepID=A0ABU6D0W2_9GAMM|nr:hypothetical protein [Candidatus Thiothrix sp. Deng01]MEB4592707.1 hypothetical protein [Candidatus Thiothrix sp. Deng01]
MKLKALFIALTLSVATSAFAANDKKADEAKPAEAKATDGKSAEAKKDEDKIALKDSVSAEIKSAYEAADKENSASKKAGFEWFMDDKNMSQILEDGVKAANDGKDEDAMKIFKKVEAAGKAGQEQAKTAKTAAPHF